MTFQDMLHFCDFVIRLTPSTKFDCGKLALPILPHMLNQTHIYIYTHIIYSTCSFHCPHFRALPLASSNPACRDGSQSDGHLSQLVRAKMFQLPHPPWHCLWSLPQQSLPRWKPSLMPHWKILRMQVLIWPGKLR